MSKETEYLILKPSVWLPEDMADKILGASVRNHLDPARAYTPENAILFRTASPKSTTFEGFVLKTDKPESKSWEIEVKGLGKLRRSKTDNESLSLSGKILYIRRLIQQPDYWKKIKQNETFRKTTTEWISEAKKEVKLTQKLVGKTPRPICLVTSIVLCQDVDVYMDAKKAKERIDKGEAALGTIATIAANAHGLPGPGEAGNTSISTESKTASATYFKAKGKGTYICGLELRIIKLNRTDAKEHGNKGDKDELTLTDDQPDFDRKLGSGDDIDEIELSSAILAKPDEAEWKALLEFEG